MESVIPHRNATPTSAPADAGPSWLDHHQLIPAVAAFGSKAILVAALYYRPASGATRALVALISGIIFLLATLAVVVWLVVLAFASAAFGALSWLTLHLLRRGYKLKH